MTILVLETFLLMVVSVALGVAIGMALRELAGARSARPAFAGSFPPDEIPEPEPRQEPSSASIEDTIIDPVRAAAADQVGVRPPPLAHPRDGVPDDLKRIRGIGPQTEARLNALGIHHIDQIAAWSPDEVRWVGTYLASSGRIDREDWVGQARGSAAAAGD